VVPSSYVTDINVRVRVWNIKVYVIWVFIEKFRTRFDIRISYEYADKERRDFLKSFRV